MAVYTFTRRYSESEKYPPLWDISSIILLGSFSNVSLYEYLINITATVSSNCVFGRSPGSSIFVLTFPVFRFWPIISSFDDAASLHRNRLLWHVNQQFSPVWQKSRMDYSRISFCFSVFSNSVLNPCFRKQLILLFDLEIRFVWNLNGFSYLRRGFLNIV